MRPVSHLTLNILLALVWMLLFGDFTMGNLMVGLVVGFLAISFSRPVLRSQRYVRAVMGTFRLIIGFLRELTLANLQLARDILSPVPPFVPGFVAFDVRDLGPTETVALANLVSLTPGTLSVDLDDDGFTLYVHTLYAQDPEDTRRGIRKLANLVHGALGDDPYFPEAGT
jgi:multicomponent Na+:H+ antiporter subunit E